MILIKVRGIDRYSIIVISYHSPNNVTTSHNRPTKSNASMRNPIKPPIRASGSVRRPQSQESRSSRTGPNILITTTTITIVSIMESIICPLILSGLSYLIFLLPALNISTIAQVSCWQLRSGLLYYRHPHRIQMSPYSPTVRSASLRRSRSTSISSFPIGLRFNSIGKYIRHRVQLMNLDFEMYISSLI